MVLAVVHDAPDLASAGDPELSAGAKRENNADVPQIELEKLQSIITADGQIMIQEMSITIYQKADPTAVERFYIQHQEEDRHKPRDQPRRPCPHLSANQDQGVH